MGTLSVQVSVDHGKTWSADLNYTLSDRNATSVSGNQGTNWLQGFINLSPYVSATALVIRFTAVTGSALDGDIALDDVQVMDLPVTAVTVDGNIILSDDLFSIDDAFGLGARPMFPEVATANLDLSAKYKIERNLILSADYNLYLLNGSFSNRLKSELGFKKVFKFNIACIR